jgi:hypothetical protein
VEPGLGGEERLVAEHGPHHPEPLAQVLLRGRLATGVRMEVADVGDVLERSQQALRVAVDQARADHRQVAQPRVALHLLVHGGLVVAQLGRPARPGEEDVVLVRTLDPHHRVAEPPSQDGGELVERAGAVVRPAHVEEEALAVRRRELDRLVVALVPVAPVGVGERPVAEVVHAEPVELVHERRPVPVDRVVVAHVRLHADRVAEVRGAVRGHGLGRRGGGEGERGDQHRRGEEGDAAHTLEVGARGRSGGAAPGRWTNVLGSGALWAQSRR